MPVLLLVRHGQASFGAADYDVLSPLGAAQAEALHAALGAAEVVPSLLVAGSLRRQRDSAAPWTAGGAELRTDPRWDEYDSADVLEAHGEVPVAIEHHGDPSVPAVSSQTFQAVLDPALERWIEAGEGTSARESWPAFRARVLGALEEVAGTLGRGETGLVFTSGGVVAACAAALLGAEDRVFVPLNRTAVNAAFSRVLVGRRGLSLLSYNEQGHLAGDLVTYR